MTIARPAAVIVLAAGEGTRMKSAVPKVLHSIGGRTLLGHAIAAARGTGAEHLSVVVRHERDLVAAHVAEVAPDAVIADQDEVKGTGRATECALDALPGDLDGTVLVTYGDVPLLSAETLHGLLEAHATSGSAATVITATLPDPTGYGRILRDADGSVSGIVEQKDATDEQLAITEINSGIYAFEATVLRKALAQVGTDNAQGEKYLTDVLAIARTEGLRVGAHLIQDLWQTEGVNDRVQLARLGAELNRRIVEGWMRQGVTVVDPATTWIDTDVSLGRDVTIHPQTQLHGATTIGDDVTIGPDTTLAHVEIRDGATVVRTHGSHALDRRRRHGRPVRLPAAGHRARRPGQDRHVRRDQERLDRRRLQGAAPVLRRRRDDRRAVQHRRGQRLRQLRRRQQAPHHHRQPLPHRVRQHVRRPGHRRRRRLHRCRHRGPQGRAAGGAGRQRGTPAQPRGVGAGQAGRHRRRHGCRGRLSRTSSSPDDAQDPTEGTTAS